MTKAELIDGLKQISNENLEVLYESDDYLYEIQHIKIVHNQILLSLKYD